ncbi:hypothetical protein NQ315_010990 [Exocentrus adspersus]|uniref:DDE Tnp4 domain-containing protein n=1 Tax=Exocentrus adspersus TaxID=1586481 RepID=A0AAV8V951_9CUCU|nr:hypothetical protein NQ315_010990 [Exocentrus adspersus]
MSVTTFDYLLSRLRSSISRNDTLMGVCIPPSEMLAVTLSCVYGGYGSEWCTWAMVSSEDDDSAGEGEELGYSPFLILWGYQGSGLNRGNLCRIAVLLVYIFNAFILNIIMLWFFMFIFTWYLASGNTEVCAKIWKILKDECIPKPSKEYWLKISKEFTKRAHFPHCIGAVDGKHVRVFKFRGSGSMNLNYKNYFSIVLMAIAHADYRFVYVDIGAYGKDCDSSVFQQTVFFLNAGRREIRYSTTNTT